ncbi:peptidylprolyl isomerase [Fulvimarina sp. 2208YS6-2-32]|uniref:Parvulin-like PPIase n=1 Tax=Fulvimarina uroteuthidis TaxID=3098149 RepID=A0ABU5I583_9HYPH|nr:peptidylprolyl isomerase [Fulvimarina sp. 2208YS6-2-32]MDY8110548.1 peptidylprolyl isomerase [Fulvimarina sp. 2208YS6-2-32]
MAHSKHLGLIAATLAAGLLSGAAAFAQSPVVATVGSEEITEADLAAAQAEIGSDFQRVPEEQRKIAVLAALIDIKALAQEAEKASMQDNPETTATIDFLRDRTLHNAYFAKEGVETVTEEELRARYEKEIAAVEPQEEVHARHILLKSEADAKAVIQELQDGTDFAELAKEKSTGPTGPNGGDLGFFSAGQMVPEFEKAAFALEPGSFTTEPVQTQFGWHVIKVDEKRKAEGPSFEQVQEQIQRVVLQEKYVGLVGKAREELGVTYVDPAVKGQMDELKAQSDAAAAAAAPSESTPDAN